jgi:hypothetical protein
MNLKQKIYANILYEVDIYWHYIFSYRQLSDQYDYPITTIQKTIKQIEKIWIYKAELHRVDWKIKVYKMIRNSG